MDDARPLGGGADESPFAAVPIEIVVSVGKARPRIRDLLTLGADTVLALDTRIEDPVELFVGDRLIGRGILEEAEGSAQGQLAVRVIELSDLQGSLG